MSNNNEGFDPKIIDKFKSKMIALGQNYIIENDEDTTDEFVNFYFAGMHEGKPVIYDTILYTLRLHHNSELFELAEHKAAKRFPEFRTIKYEEDENGDLAKLDDLDEEIGLYITEMILDLEEEEAVKVQEHIEFDMHLNFGVGVDACINVEKIDNEVIEKFIKDFNEDTLRLDKTLYSFQTEDYELS
ncbi:MAG: hypothetical protein OEW67_03775 [Cyclobacteriaceae bacterium]|nr:hypothetical protein [Cyclobacteriaceae bacterium]